MTTTHTTRTRFRYWLTSSWKAVPSDRRPGQTDTVPDHRGPGVVATPRQILAEYDALQRACGQGAWLGFRAEAADGTPVSLDALRQIVSEQDWKRHGRRR